MDLDAMMARARAEHRKLYPKDAQGRDFCPKHKRLLEDDEIGCETCAIEARERREREELQRGIEIWAAHVGAPAWPWARFDNAAWRKRCDRRVVAALDGYDFKSGLLIAAPTGAGKTSSVAAAVARVHAAALADAEALRRPRLPPVFYTTGLALTEADKARRLGQERAALVEQAIGARVLLLDEVHASHTRQTVLFEVAEDRYAAGLPTVLLTGHTPKEFGEAFGAATLRRFLEGARVVDATKGGT